MARIKKGWGYDRRRGNIPTLDEWLARFANEDKIKLFWFDVKVKYYAYIIDYHNK